jgi:eukaryotic-like serine/threonine-protein kinase
VIDIGSVVNGKYRLVRILGDGGMGSVYEATHAVLGIRVAIKVLHPELVRRTGLVERFLQEARVVAQIRSPHVVQVIDVDRTPDGHAYIVMELLEGEPLSSVVDRQRKLPVSTACEYTVQILEALEAAHALGVVHRDLKPENVFVTFAGGRPVLKLIDFGIAKARRLDPRQKNLTVAGVVMGTAEYMAPEQARSADMVDPRADLYAVGVMLYEMIAGARPVRGDTGEDARVIALKVERGEIIPLVQAAPHAPRDVAGLVHHAMAARPEMRFATATEMRLALEGAMTGKRPPTKALSQPATTGTAAMGATGHVRTAASPAVTGANLEEPHVDTVRAAPVATAMAAPAYLGAGMAPLAPAEGPHPRQQPRRIPIAALLGLSLLLGASVLGILVGTGTIAFSSGPPAPPPLVAPASVPTLPTPTATPAATTAPAAPALPTLAPTRPVPTTPRPVPSNRPAPEADAGAPPFVLPTALPTTLPPFPSVFPLPAGFPSTLPSGFPSIPGWPTIQLPQPPQPAKQAAPSGSASY